MGSPLLREASTRLEIREMSRCLAVRQAKLATLGNVVKYLLDYISPHCCYCGGTRKGFSPRASGSCDVSYIFSRARTIEL